MAVGSGNLCACVRSRNPVRKVMVIAMKSWFVIVLAMLLVSAGCAEGDFSTAKVTGVVLCNGQPVEGAMVYFEPIRSGKNSAMVGKQGFSWTDASGRFDISTYKPGGGDGAVIGKHRVRVGRGKAQCDCAMNEEVDLMEVEVLSGTKNEFELVLNKATQKDKARERANLDDDEE